MPGQGVSAPKRGCLIWCGCMVWGVPGPGGLLWGCLVLGGLVQGVAWFGGVGIPACTEADLPLGEATAADGTHPTGMHSC